MTFGSLFAGIGGFDLGLERAGMQCKWQVEINPFCRKILAKHWPGVKKYDDIKKIGKNDLEPVDLICGGPPCQKTSVAAAITGNRTTETLWTEMARIIEIYLPAWVIVEQPAGNKKWENTVAMDLESFGYNYSRIIGQASDCGAPHQRRRVFFIANAMCKRLDKIPWFGESSEAFKKPWPPPPRGAWRAPRTGNCRMDDGLPNWVDRIKSLGNAVVPQLVEGIGVMIKAAHYNKSLHGTANNRRP